MKHRSWHEILGARHVYELGNTDFIAFPDFWATTGPPAFSPAWWRPRFYTREALKLWNTGIVDNLALQNPLMKRLTSKESPFRPRRVTVGPDDLKWRGLIHGTP